MKTIKFTASLLLMILVSNINAQDVPAAEKYGKTLNLGAGIGYYGYIGQTVPVGTINFEFDIAKNFTLAPFIGFYTYQRSFYWGDNNKNYPYRNYSYRAIVVPVGLKGTYYFDQLFRANAKWDFYAAASVGFQFRQTVWEDGYYGDQYVYKTASPLYLDAHVGAEYHMTEKAGLFLDLSTGVSTFGLAIHF